MRFLYIIFKESNIMQYQFTSKFGDTKNLPNQVTGQKEIKLTKSKDKGDLTKQEPIGKAYHPPQQFNLMSLMQNRTLKYPLSLNTKNIFPRNQQIQFEVEQESQWPQSNEFQRQKNLFILTQNLNPIPLLLMNNYDQKLLQRQEKSDDQYSEQDTNS